MYAEGRTKKEDAGRTQSRVWGVPEDAARSAYYTDDVTGERLPFLDGNNQLQNFRENKSK